MADYSDIGLNSQLQPVNGLVTQDRGFVSGADVKADFERNTFAGYQIQDASITNAKIGTAAIGTANIGTLSFNQITGGTAILGGTLNGNGLFKTITSIGDTFFLLNNGSMSLYGDFGGSSTADVKFDPIESQLYVRSLQIGGTYGGGTRDGVMSFDIGTNGILNIGDTGLRMLRGYPIEIGGTVNASAGSAHTVRLYVDQGGPGGKDRLMAVFNTGAAQVVASQP
jgi:hypothetical protein